MDTLILFAVSFAITWAIIAGLTAILRGPLSLGVNTLGELIWKPAVIVAASTAVATFLPAFLSLIVFAIAVHILYEMEGNWVYTLAFVIAYFVVHLALHFTVVAALTS